MLSSRGKRFRRLAGGPYRDASCPLRPAAPGRVIRPAGSLRGPRHRGFRRPAGRATSGQFLPGTAAPHAGRAFRHDVRSGPRGLVADLDQNPAALPRPGQRVAPRQLTAAQDERDVPRLVPEDLGGSLVPDDHRSAAARTAPRAPPRTHPPSRCDHRPARPAAGLRGRATAPWAPPTSAAPRPTEGGSRSAVSSRRATGRRNGEARPPPQYAFTPGPVPDETVNGKTSGRARAEVHYFSRQCSMAGTPPSGAMIIRRAVSPVSAGNNPDIRTIYLLPSISVFVAHDGLNAGPGNTACAKVRAGA